jgi:Putative Ig domain
MLSALAGCDDTNSTSASGTAAPTVVAGNPTPGSPNPGTSRATASPALSGTPAASVQVGQSYSFTPTVTGGTGSVEYRIANKPPWLAFDSSTGALAGKPSAKDVGVYRELTVSVSSGGTSAALVPFDVTVAPAGGAPVNLSWVAPVSSTNGGPLELSGYHIYYGAYADSLANVVSVGAAETSYVFDNLKSGTWYFAVAAVSAGNVESSMSAVVPAQI